ncbi:MAG: hypothetical protein PHC64_01630 [Candidatus Gastranaerophilales bacterium]|nr:hypothetical protein [Candidatus Gastranaerophilales bacterium]
MRVQSVQGQQNTAFGAEVKIPYGLLKDVSLGKEFRRGLQEIGGDDVFHEVVKIGQEFFIVTNRGRQLEMQAFEKQALGTPDDINNFIENCRNYLIKRGLFKNRTPIPLKILDIAA